MPVLDNPRYERFAQELAKGKPASRAYEAAGYKPNDGNAATLKGNQKVLERVAEIQAAGAIRAEITVETISEELAEVKALAIGAGAYGPAVAAIMGKAKVCGLVVDKRDVKVTHADLSDAELDQRIADLEAALEREGGTIGTAPITPGSATAH